MKDRIGNKLALQDKVLVELPTSSIIGFISDLQEPGVVAIRRGTAAGSTPGRILVAVVIALPVEPDSGAVPQLVKVHDAARDDLKAASESEKSTSGPQLTN